MYIILSKFYSNLQNFWSLKKRVNKITRLVQQRAKKKNTHTKRFFEQILYSFKGHYTLDCGAFALAR